ncbi:MAG: hypothetical protein ACO3UW_10145, partial [Candidatus Nanopelagicales bacterium]
MPRLADVLGLRGRTGTLSGIPRVRSAPGFAGQCRRRSSPVATFTMGTTATASTTWKGRTKPATAISPASVARSAFQPESNS